MGGEPVDLWAPFRSRPAQAGIFADFDGTLAPIVSEPTEARPLPGLVQVLSDLAGVYGRVGVLTGRPVDFLADMLPPEVLLVGLYGLEVADHGERRDHPQGGSWREVVDHVAATARAGGPPGMTVESKGLSLTLHYRGAPELADAVEDFARRQAQRSGLVCRPAKKSVELHPPIDADKGTALREHAGGLSAVCFIGDDLGDLPAFDALDEMERAGTTVVRVAVAGEESPAALCDRADLCLGGPTEVEGLLRSLVPGAAISA